MENKKHLIGKTKREILLELGEGYNFFPDNKWSYFQRKDIWYRNVFLMLIFKDNITLDSKIIKTYKKNCL